MEQKSKPTSQAHKVKKYLEQMELLNSVAKVRVGPSKIHGVGVYAMRDLKKGEKMNLDAMSQWLDLPYKYFTKKGAKGLRPEVAQLLLERWPQIVNGSHFVYPDTRMQAFMNHSDFPNYDAKTDVTLCKLYAGEELTEDYRQIEGWEKVFPWLVEIQEKNEVNEKTA